MKLNLNNGIHDISNETYHESNGLSRSALWEFKKSPWHYWNKYLNPNAVTEKPTTSMKLGELLHVLVLEPHTFNDRYILEPQMVSVPKLELLKDVGREKYECQKLLRESALSLNKTIGDRFVKEAAQGKEVVSRMQCKEAKDMAASVLSDQTAQLLFATKDIEKSIYFTHQSTGLQCKVRPDAWSNCLVVDLKTVKDAGYKSFQSSSYNYGYFLQAAMIKAGLESVGMELEKFVFYCVEKSTGYPCVYYILDDEAIDYGTNQFNALMEKFAGCLESDQWNGYEPKTLYLPNYSKYEEQTND